MENLTKRIIILTSLWKTRELCICTNAIPIAKEPPSKNQKSWQYASHWFYYIIMQTFKDISPVIMVNDTDRTRSPTVNYSCVEKYILKHLQRYFITS
jgi:hypothetical protein